jgi:ankyrin repeat protein
MTKKQRDRMLWEGCESGDFNKVRLAINFGADLEAKNEWGQTPLHEASYNDSIAIAKLLIDAGADLKAKTNMRETPLDRARSDKMRKLLKKYIK